VAAPDPAAALLALLGAPDIRSKEEVIRRYDHEVHGATAVKPLTGAADGGPGDAAVLRPLDALWPPSARENGQPAVAIANGICPAYGALDPYAMAWAAVDEAFRNVVAVGGDPDRVALLDNFCWGNPNLPDRLGSLARCAEGAHDAAVAFGAPFISGKDSLHNEYTAADGEKHAIPGTLLISAAAIVPDVARAVTMDLKEPGNFLYLLGETRPELGGSQYAAAFGTPPGGDRPPRPVPDALVNLRLVHQAMQAGLVRACHDCSDGGLAVALAEMALGGRLGAEVTLAADLPDPVKLFAESLGRLVVEVRPADAARCEALFAGRPLAQIGRVTAAAELAIRDGGGRPILTLAVEALERAWRGGGAAERGSSGDGPRTVGLQTAASTESQAHPQTPSLGHFPTIAAPRVLILHANGTNRDREAALACAAAGGAAEVVHVNQLLAGERRLADYHFLILPGGFSYGDDLGAGTVWALDLRHRLGEDLARFVASGRPVLGICNGFQALVKAGVLGSGGDGEMGSRGAGGHANGGGEGGRGVTLTFNESGRFECCWVYLQPNPASHCLFTAGLDDLIYCPVAHGEGRLAADAPALADLEARGLIALQYVDANGEAAGYPANPNGSALNVAGLTNAAGNVLGLMPHPEDHIFDWQHPRWTRGERGRRGLALFKNALKQA
jgi:phosphoribosylformylglycinamidine synthase